MAIWREIVSRQSYTTRYHDVRRGAVSWSLKLSCGHEQRRKGSQMPKGNVVRCKACEGRVDNTSIEWLGNDVNQVCGYFVGDTPAPGDLARILRVAAGKVIVDVELGTGRILAFHNQS